MYDFSIDTVFEGMFFYSVQSSIQKKLKIIQIMNPYIYLPRHEQTQDYDLKVSQKK